MAAIAEVASAAVANAPVLVWDLTPNLIEPLTLG